MTPLPLFLSFIDDINATNLGQPCFNTLPTPSLAEYTFTCIGSYVGVEWHGFVYRITNIAISGLTGRKLELRCATSGCPAAVELTGNGQFGELIRHICTQPAMPPVMVPKFGSLQEALNFRGELYAGSCRLRINLFDVNSNALAQQLAETAPAFPMCWLSSSSRCLSIWGPAEKIVELATKLAKEAPSHTFPQSTEPYRTRSSHHEQQHPEGAQSCSFCAELGYSYARRTFSINV